MFEQFFPLMKRLLSTPVLTTIILLTVLWQAYERYGPQKPDISALRKTIADTIVDRIADNLPNETSVKSIFIFKFEQDDSEYVTNTLRKKLSLRGVYKIIPKKWIEKIKDDLKLPEPTVSNLNFAVETATKIGADGVIFGKINSFNETKDGANLDLAIQFVSVKTGKTLFAQNYRQNLTSLAAALTHNSGSINMSSLAVRAFYWLLFLLILPPASVPFIKLILKKESNLANFLMIAGYTTADFIFALALVGFHIEGIAIPLFLIAALLSGAAYNYWFCTLISNLEKR